MASGTPVVASRRGAIPEVAGEAAVLLEPEDVDEWTPALRGLLTDEAERAYRSTAGILRARPFNWDKTAAATLAVLDGSDAQRANGRAAA
jgi:glycosyltransferase involved in cell wall biosynthesis